MEIETALQSIDHNLNYLSRVVSQKTFWEFEDAKQELILRILELKYKYDEKKSGMKTFFIMVAKTHTARMLKEARRGNYNFYFSMRSLNDLVGGENGIELQDHVVSKRNDFNEIDISEILDLVEKNICGRAKIIFSLMRYHGSKLKEISELLCLSKQHICNIVRKEIRPLVEKFYLYDG